MTAPADPVQLRVRVTARARRDEIVGVRDGVVLVRVSAPPVEGRANAAVCRLLARRLGVGVRNVTVLRGASAREKTLVVAGVETAQVARLLAGRPS